MTDTAAPHPAPPTPKPRPTAVTAATWLLVAVAAAYLIDAIMLIAGAGGYPDRVREALEASDVDPRAWPAPTAPRPATPHPARTRPRSTRPHLRRSPPSSSRRHWPPWNAAASAAS